MRIAESGGNAEECRLRLLKRCKNDDPDACNELLGQFNRRIFNTAFRILGEESSAEDAMQETLLNAYRGLSRFRGDAKVSTWISRITVNVCLGMLRKGRNKRFVDLEDEGARELQAEQTTQTDPAEHASHEELRGFIAETFRRMSEKQEVVVRMHDLEGHTIKEIARTLGCPSGTVKSRLFYGRQEFKEIFNSLTARAFQPVTVH